MKKGYVHLIKADYNAATGESKVMIDTELGAFYGFAKLHSEDKKIASAYAGCRYAETRAIVKYLKMRKKFAIAQRSAIANLGISLKGKKLEKINKELEEYDDYIENIEISIDNTVKELKSSIENRPELLKRIHNDEEEDK